MPVFSELLIKRFFNGQCTEKEAEAVLNWLLDPGNQHLAKRIMKRQWETLSGDGDVDIESLLERTQSRLKLGKFREAGSREKQRWYRSIPLRIAATFLLIAMSLAALMITTEENQEEALASNSAKVEVSTSTGQIILKVLPDGTKVWLNAQSKLIYPETFGATREVRLQGEGFFDVADNKDRPFIVHADDIQIRVLGTAFNIKSYPGDPSIATTLVRGKVLIEQNKNDRQTRIELEPNQQAVFSHALKDISLHRVDANKYSSWTNGSLIFEDDRVYDVFKTLERWYGVSITIEDDSNLSCRLTARIDKESLTETLELLKSITGIRYSIAGSEVTIDGTICTP